MQSLSSENGWKALFWYPNKLLRWGISNYIYIYISLFRYGSSAWVSVTWWYRVVMLSQCWSCSLCWVCITCTWGRATSRPCKHSRRPRKASRSKQLGKSSCKTAEGRSSLKTTYTLVIYSIKSMKIIKWHGRDTLQRLSKHLVPNCHSCTQTML